MKTLTPAQVAAVDFEHSGRITLGDVSLMLRYVVGLLTSLPNPSGASPASPVTVPGH